MIVINGTILWYDVTFNRSTASIIAIIFVPAAHNIYIGPVKRKCGEGRIRLTRFLWFSN